jgi:hypothetical protein
MSVTGRVGSADSCRTAASHRANARRSNGSGVLRVASRTSKASAGVRHVVSSRRRPSALGHACCRSTTRPRSVAGASPKAGRQPTAVVTIPTQNVSPRGSLTIGRSCGPMRKPVSVTRAVLTDRGLPDGVSKDDGRDGRPGGSNTLAGPGDTTLGEPDHLDEATDLTSGPARHVLEHGSTVLSSDVRRLHAASWPEIPRDPRREESLTDTNLRLPDSPPLPLSAACPWRSHCSRAHKSPTAHTWRGRLVRADHGLRFLGWCKVRRS